MNQKLNPKLKIFAFVLTLAIMLAPLVSALSILPPNYPTDPLGNSQYYTVTFDAEGEAIVVAKLIFQNTGSLPLGAINLEIPGQVEMINAVQEVKAEKKDANNFYYGSWKYKTLLYFQNTLSTSSTFTFNLPQPVGEQEQATILLYYKVKGLAQQEIFDYRFNFETVKHSQYTQQVRVSVAVQEGLYLKSGEAKLNYNSFTFAAQSAFASAEVSSQEMGKLSQSLMYAPGWVKTASELDPWESFSVNGIYSSSQLWLYKWNILGGLIIFAGLILLCAWGLRRIKSNLKKELPFSGVLWGLGNSLVALAVGWFGFYLLSHLPRMFSYQLRDAVGIIIAFVLVILGFLLLLGFPVYLALQRNDWRIGLMVFASTIFGLVVGGMILVVVMEWV